MDEKTVKLLEDIKRLMILSLIEKGIQSKRIADALGVDPAIISRMISIRKK